MLIGDGKGESSSIGFGKVSSCPFFGCIWSSYYSKKEFWFWKWYGALTCAKLVDCMCCVLYSFCNFLQETWAEKFLVLAALGAWRKVIFCKHLWTHLTLFLRGEMLEREQWVHTIWRAWHLALLNLPFVRRRVNLHLTCLVWCGLISKFPYITFWHHISLLSDCCMYAPDQSL